MKKLTILICVLIICVTLISFLKRPHAAGPLDYGTVQAENGTILRYLSTTNGYLLILTPGQEILASLTAFQKAMKFPFATATGIGNVSNVQLGQYNLHEKAMDKSEIYQDAHEVSSLICNMSILIDSSGAEKPLPHCHLSMALSPAEGFHLVGGHLISATIAVVGEIYISTAVMSPAAVKTHDPYFNGNLFDLSILSALHLTE